MIIGEGRDFPASDKQMDLIIKLADQLDSSLEKICEIGEVEDINNLTEGKTVAPVKLLIS